MLSIILMILKIFGILILSLIGIILFLIILILFVPIRYKSDISYMHKDHDISALGEISWLFKLIKINLSYDKDMDLSIKILGIKINNNNENLEEEPGNNIQKENLYDKEVTEHEKESFSMNSEEDIIFYKENSAMKNKEDKVQAKSTYYDENKKAESSNHKYEKKNISKISKKERKTISLKNKVLEIIIKIRNRINNIFSSIENVKLKIQKILQFLNRDSNKALFKLLWIKLKKLILHILPKKVDIAAKIGFEDVSLTGNILAVAGLLYPLYRDKIKITPDFTKEIIDIDAKFNGRIYIFYLIYTILRIWFDRNFQTIYKNYKKGNIFA